MVWEKRRTRSTCSTSCISTIVARRRPARHGARAEDSRDSHCSAHPLPRRAAGDDHANQSTNAPTHWCRGAIAQAEEHPAVDRTVASSRLAGLVHTRSRSTVALRRARGVSTHLAPEARLVEETPSARRMDRVLSTSPGATPGCAARRAASTASLSCEGQGPASMPGACRGRVAAISPDCRSGAFGPRGFESRPRLFTLHRGTSPHTPS
jgi:hypothetical protein